MNVFWEALPDLVLGLPLVILGLVLFLARRPSFSGKHGFFLAFGALGIGMHVILEPNGGHIKIGKNTSINSFSIISGAGGVNIGNYVAIAPRCSIISSNHIYKNPSVPIKLQGISTKGVSIGDDVWIGTGVTILDDVSIGSGCVIGAASVVTKDIPEYSVAVGIPAIVIKMRK